MNPDLARFALGGGLSRPRRAVALWSACVFLVAGCGGSNIEETEGPQDGGMLDGTTPASGEASACNAQTCPIGCCDVLGQCQPGSSNTHCGNLGGLCQRCSDVSPGMQCVGQLCVLEGDAAVCSDSTCPAGCCDTSGQCQQGITGLACGHLGTNCQNCLAMSELCSSAQLCVPQSSDAGPACNAQTCPLGCCDGSGQQTRCPESYPSCPPSLQEPAPTRQHWCSTADLQNAAQACSAGASASTASCDSFFGCSNTACATCLKQFDFDFVDQIGIRTCVAPFVDATCNHNSACIADCTAESCFHCPDNASTSQCETQVQAATCAAYTQADQCVVQALAGAAAFCNPVTYQGHFGAWLQGVGAKYCGL